MFLETEVPSISTSPHQPSATMSNFSPGMIPEHHRHGIRKLSRLIEFLDDPCAFEVTLLITGPKSEAHWKYPRRLFAKRTNPKTARTTPASFAGIPQVSLAVVDWSFVFPYSMGILLITFQVISHVRDTLWLLEQLRTAEAAELLDRVKASKPNPPSFVFQSHDGSGSRTNIRFDQELPIAFGNKPQ
ncbi:predicted protein [Histoplasma capsulatum var. duboisii H88]|uniref:Predicted protein n=1 Tax=Ajellomyces capsulatus (strain H88) TaxID=544711 RepID=F0UWD5_AJEC8|nr:predicted protein [Histoplasma capsulatum var. duboisii H88]